MVDLVTGRFIMWYFTIQLILFFLFCENNLTFHWESSTHGVFKILRKFILYNLIAERNLIKYF